MSDELRPCPFCGHEPTHFGSNAPWAVACTNESCLCPASADYVGAWNTRPVEDALRAQLAAAEAERDWLRAVLDQVRDADRMLAEADARYAGAQKPQEAAQ